MRRARHSPAATRTRIPGRAPLPHAAREAGTGPMYGTVMIGRSEGPQTRPGGPTPTGWPNAHRRSPASSTRGCSSAMTVPRWSTGPVSSTEPPTAPSPRTPNKTPGTASGSNPCWTDHPTGSTGTGRTCRQDGPERARRSHASQPNRRLPAASERVPLHTDHQRRGRRSPARRGQARRRRPRAHSRPGARRRHPSHARRRDPGPQLNQGRRTQAARGR